MNKNKISYSSFCDHSFTRFLKIRFFASQLEVSYLRSLFEQVLGKDGQPFKTANVDIIITNVTVWLKRETVNITININKLGVQVYIKVRVS